MTTTMYHSLYLYKPIPKVLVNNSTIVNTLRSKQKLTHLHTLLLNITRWVSINLQVLPKKSNINFIFSMHKN